MQNKCSEPVTQNHLHICKYGDIENLAVKESNIPNYKLNNSATINNRIEIPFILID